MSQVRPTGESAAERVPPTLSPVLPSDFSLLHPLRVRWAEADMQGVVFNGHYLTYFDLAITEWLRALFDGVQEDAHSAFEKFFVRKAMVEYLSPARFDDCLWVGARCARLGGSSMTVAFALFRPERGADLIEGETAELLATGESIYVYTEAAKPSRVPDDLRTRIRRFERKMVA